MTRLRFEPVEHRYYLRNEDGSGEERLTSVTTLIAQYAKPKLVPWAAGKAADYAVDNWDALSAQPLSERRTNIAKAADYVRDEAAASGTQLHLWADALISGESVEVPERYRTTVEHFARWWDESGLRAIDREAMVWSGRGQWLLKPYAGTLDCVAIDGMGRYWLLDFKSGGVYESAAYQLAGYASAEWIVRDGQDVEMPPLRKGAIWGALQLKPDACRLLTLDPSQQLRARTWFENSLGNSTAGVPRFKLEARNAIV